MIHLIWYTSIEKRPWAMMSHRPGLAYVESFFFLDSGYQWLMVRLPDTLSMSISIRPSP